ncbi:hypothetical protein MJT46_017249 [Ovis ammon polii x Ovis aries]|nr:hypothetical protein MJT46_017249 [Ovis ammon polii x Ovis aries]
MTMGRMPSSPEGAVEALQLCGLKTEREGAIEATLDGFAGPAALEWDVASHQDFIHSQCRVLCLLLGYQVGILKPNSKHIHERKKLKKLPGIKSYKDLVFLSHGFPVLSFLDSISWNGAFGSGTPDSAVQAGRTRAEKLNLQPYGFPKLVKNPEGRRHVWRTTLPPAPPFPDFSQRWGEEPVPSVRQPGARRPGDRCLVPSGGAGDDEGELLTDS